ncbi:MAG: nucleotide sugar dehydrogenase [Halieaceae bacterium]|jgi:UDP-N-acetyl-D-glucosamine/UDP-N-acetyl-D-galactosamine dehydrogenase|nr:nucleotide sugar dehydrogenase [Halieaceae bacterium]
MDTTIAIVGLGYVGLPLAVAFGRQFKTIGFDQSEGKLALYRQGHDPNGEVEQESLRSATGLAFTSDPSLLAEANIIIIVVPTPIDLAKRPDLGPLEAACTTVGENMKPGVTIIFESTVYPGCTEEVCVPILEQISGMPWLGCDETEDGAEGFYIGYSPERINPGDKVHRVETITKVVAGDSRETLERVAVLYESIVTAGVHRAATIKVAEAAKVIENTQRDLNIALMNELAMIFNKLEIDTLDVLTAAGTKWNFLPFRPGLVGGHCVGVDPYYLTYKAQSVGFHPQVVLGGRQTNDGMGKYIAEQTIKQLVKRGHRVSGARITVLGLSFKEDCPDLRNSRVEDIITELTEYCCEVAVHDPIASAAEAQQEYNVELCPWEQLPIAHAIVLAVPHREYLSRGVEGINLLLKPNGVIIDVRSALDRKLASGSGVQIWRL